MRLRHGWLIVLVIAALLAVACGSEGVIPTPANKVDSGDSPTSAPAQVGNTPTAAQVDDTPTVAQVEETQVEETVEETVSSGDLPVDSDDWHVLGSPDAPVTIVEYSDFQ